MESKIRLLSDHTINKIAAGEVIENPASVVKELVENSLDAGATEISVEIKGGGRQSIRITDNGSGMSPDDALLCLERHATSKLKDVDDLQAIGTMGFRGEAVPSIAAISKFMILTCPPGKETGTMVLVDGGAIQKCCPAACAAGTTIEVKNLFFNVPVRKKFLKSPAYDANEVLKTMTLLALGYPEVKFSLISNGETVLAASEMQGASPSERLGERIAAVLGADFQSHLVPVSGEQGPMKLQGFAGLPEQHRHNRGGQYLFINRRAVFSPLISYTIREAYGPMLPSNRHPVFVLHLELPGSTVDVNVHPQKKEVRIRREAELRSLIMEAVEGAFRSQPQPEEPPFIPSADFSSFFQQKVEERSDIFSEPEPLPVFPIEPREYRQPTFLETAPSQPSVRIPRILATIPGFLLIEPPAEKFDSNALCLLDQRAAYSRIVYERLLKKGALSQASQALLIPHNWETSPAEAGRLREALPDLNKLGIGIKEFGPQAFLIDSLPQLMGSSSPQELVNAILENIEKKEADGDIRRQALAAAVGSTSLSRTKKMPPEEAHALLQQLFQCDTPYLCPQGKPTIVGIQTADLAKLFQKHGGG